MESITDRLSALQIQTDLDFSLTEAGASQASYAFDDQSSSDASLIVELVSEIDQPHSKAKPNLNDDTRQLVFETLLKKSNDGKLKRGSIKELSEQMNINRTVKAKTSY